MFAAQFVAEGNVIVVQPDAAVIHQHQFVDESGDLGTAAVILFHGGGERILVIDPDRDRFDGAVGLENVIHFMPHAAEHLGHDGGAVIVRFLAVLEIGHHEKHGRFAAVFRGREVRLKPVEPRQHHLERGFAGETAGLQIDHPVQHMSGGLLHHIFERVVIAAGDPVGDPHQFPFEQARDMSAGVVVGDVGDADLHGVPEQFVTGEIVSAAGLIMFALADHGEPAVLADAIESQAGQRGVFTMECAVERGGAGPVGTAAERRSEFFSDPAGQRIQFLREFRRKTINLRFRGFFEFGITFQSECGGGAADLVDVIRPGQIRQ